MQVYNLKLINNAIMKENTFVKIIKRYIIDNNKDKDLQEIKIGREIRYMLQGITDDIHNWPEVDVSEEDEDWERLEEVDLENVSIINISENILEITAGGDWQPVTFIKIQYSEPSKLTCIESHVIPDNKWGDFRELSQKVMYDILDLGSIKHLNK